MTIALQKGLVAHYPLDKESLQSATTFADKTPNENVGISANTPVFITDRMGQADRAMSFNGVDDYVDCGNDASLNIGTNDYTASVWIKTTDATGYSRIISTNYTTSWIPIYLHVHTGLLRTGVGGGFFSPTGGSDVTTGDWVHCVVSADRSGNASFYVNGVLDGVADISGKSAFNITGNTLYIGGTTTFFNGSIADIRIYNRALSQQEITALYEQYRPKLSLGSLQKGLVLDMPLTSKRYNVGNSKFDDLTPYENRGVNNGGDVDTDHTTFVAANRDYVRIPDSESLSPTSAMTAMVWVKGESQKNYIFTHYDPSVNQRSFAFRNLDLSNKVSIYVSEDGQSGSGHFKNYQSSIVVFDNTRHLIGFTFDAGTLKLFVDGVEDTNPTKTADDAITIIHDSTADVMVGCFLDNNDPANFFNGDISGAKIWNRALSGREILLSFEKQKGEFL